MAKDKKKSKSRAGSVLSTPASVTSVVSKGKGRTRRFDADDALSDVAESERGSIAIHETGEHLKHSPNALGIGMVNDQNKENMHIQEDFEMRRTSMTRSSSRTSDGVVEGARSSLPNSPVIGATTEWTTAEDHLRRTRDFDGSVTEEEIVYERASWNGEGPRPFSGAMSPLKAMGSRRSGRSSTLVAPPMMATSPPVHHFGVMPHMPPGSQRSTTLQMAIGDLVSPPRRPNYQPVMNPPLDSVEESPRLSKVESIGPEHSISVRRSPLRDELEELERRSLKSPSVRSAILEEPIPVAGPSGTRASSRANSKASNMSKASNVSKASKVSKTSKVSKISEESDSNMVEEMDIVYEDEILADPIPNIPPPPTTSPRLRTRSDPHSRTFHFALNPSPNPSGVPRPRPTHDLRIQESGGLQLRELERAMYGRHRHATERFYWGLSPTHDERVSSLLEWVEKTSWGLANLGLMKFLAWRRRGGLVTNADYRPWRSPNEPAFDWVTTEDAQNTLDRTLQESIATYDPATTVYIFVLLPSKSGSSIGIWRKRVNLPPSLQLQYADEVERVKKDLTKTAPGVLRVEAPLPKPASAVPSGPIPAQATPIKKKKGRPRWWQFWK